MNDNKNKEEEKLIDALNEDFAKLIPKQAALVVRFDEITLHIKKIDEEKYRMRYAEYLCDVPSNREVMKGSGEVMKKSVSMLPELDAKEWKEEKKGMIGVGLELVDTLGNIRGYMAGEFLVGSMLGKVTLEQIFMLGRGTYVNMQEFDKLAKKFDEEKRVRKPKT